MHQESKTTSTAASTTRRPGVLPMHPLSTQYHNQAPAVVAPPQPSSVYVAGRLALATTFDYRESSSPTMQNASPPKKLTSSSSSSGLLGVGCGGGGERRSRSIPIHPASMKRTPSELQLCEDEEMADFRDYVMFTRIVDGIARQQHKDYWLKRENDMCLAHIIGTRNADLSSAASSSLYPKHHHHHLHHQGMANTPKSPPESLYHILDETCGSGGGDEIFTLDM